MRELDASRNENLSKKLNKEEAGSTRLNCAYLRTGLLTSLTSVADSESSLEQAQQFVVFLKQDLCWCHETTRRMSSGIPGYIKTPRRGRQGRGQTVSFTTWGPARGPGTQQQPRKEPVLTPRSQNTQHGRHGLRARAREPCTRPHSKNPLEQGALERECFLPLKG